jgi:hypothetical protein
MKKMKRFVLSARLPLGCMSGDIIRIIPENRINELKGIIEDKDSEGSVYWDISEEKEPGIFDTSDKESTKDIIAELGIKIFLKSLQPSAKGKNGQGRR